MEQEQDIPLRFKPQVLEYVCNVLGRQPYAEVAPVLADIQRQLAQRAQPAAAHPLPNGQDLGQVQ